MLDSAAPVVVEAGGGQGPSGAQGVDGRRTTVRIVGEAFFTQGEGMQLLTRTSTLGALGLDTEPRRFYVQTKAGTAQASYLDSLNAALDPSGAVARPNTADSSSVIAA